MLQAITATAFATGHPALWLLMALSGLSGVGTAMLSVPAVRHLGAHAAENQDGQGRLGR